MTWRAIGSVASGTVMSRSDGLTLTGITARTGSKAGLASLSCSNSSRIATNWPKCASFQCPRGPSPCSRISSMARCAEATSVTETSSGQPKYCWVACARGGPTNSDSSPNFSARCAMPASMDRYTCPTVAKSWLRGDVEDVLAPALDRLGFGGGQALVGGLLQAERGVQVPAHDPVLELRGLAEHVDQRLAVLDDERRLGRSLAAPSSDHLGQAPP